MKIILCGVTVVGGVGRAGGVIESAHRIAGLHWKGSPRAARVAEYTPKFSRNPLTVAIIKNAAMAKRLRRRGGTL